MKLAQAAYAPSQPSEPHAPSSGGDDVVDAEFTELDDDQKKAR